MERLDSEKLSVEFGPGVTETEPILGRKYTLTHSDETAELFLAIGLDYALSRITKMRDEVLAVWRKQEGVPFLFVHVYVDGQMGPGTIAIRDAIFRRELPLALEAIRYGDRKLFQKHPYLDDAQIWIHFDSSNPAYNKLENWGTLGDYR